jgi:hypothetical protein
VTLKCFTFVRRAEGVSLNEFGDLWRDWHARWLGGTNELRRHVARCELNLRLLADAQRQRGRGEVADSGFDGVEVLWFDSLPELEALHTAPRWSDALAAATFTDGASVSTVTHEPDVIIDTERRPEAEVKLLSIFRRSSNLDLSTFHEHWRSHHGGLFRDVAELNQFVIGYDQNHSIAAPGLEFDGVTEQWFASLDSFAQFVASPARHNMVEPDVAYFLDPANIHFLLAEPETAVID